ncbi:MAG: DNA mismatch repair protein MutL, partial [Clostridiales bacterium]|nr:DNA mismatch repair protein MutL [Clostridiales bacterium]
LNIQVDPSRVDVNVHPTKMEVRFADQNFVYEQVYNAVKEGLIHRELIPEFTIDNKTKTEKRMNADIPASDSEKATTAPDDAFTQTVTARSGLAQGRSPENSSEKAQQTTKHFRYPEPFEKVRSQLLAESTSPYEPKYPGHSAAATDFRMPEKKPGVLKPVTGTILNGTTEASASSSSVSEQPKNDENTGMGADSEAPLTEHPEQNAGAPTGKPVQMELFDDKLLSEQNIKRHKLVGQVFDTYWIVEFQDNMYIIDQHAAHEKVLYERFMKNLAEKKQTSQMITPPIIVSLSMQEEEMLKKHMDRFTEVGFEVEPFGGREYAICAVPGNLYGIAEGALFLEMLDGLTDVSERASDQSIREKIASMSCKAAVKGNHRLSTAEVDALIGELLSLENPYNCPHGRPTIIMMSKYELEKKFKRIV